jgi:hypothetical protein
MTGKTFRDQVKLKKILNEKNEVIKDSDEIKRDEEFKNKEENEAQLNHPLGHRS